MKLEFVCCYINVTGTTCYRWKVLEGEGVIRRIPGHDVVVKKGDEIAILREAFWNGENRFVKYNGDRIRL